MIEEMVNEAVDRTATAETQLWQTVIARAVEEWLHGSGRRKEAAERYLFDNNRDFPAVCRSAGMDAEYLRGRLRRLRAQGSRDVGAIAA
jgi:hypothetical protein